MSIVVEVIIAPCRPQLFALTDRCCVHSITIKLKTQVYIFVAHHIHQTHMHRIIIHTSIWHWARSFTTHILSWSGRRCSRRRLSPNTRLIHTISDLCVLCWARMFRVMVSNSRWRWCTSLLHQTSYMNNILSYTEPHHIITTSAFAMLRKMTMIIAMMCCRARDDDNTDTVLPRDVMCLRVSAGTLCKFGLPFVSRSCGNGACINNSRTHHHANWIWACSRFCELNWVQLCVRTKRRRRQTTHIDRCRRAPTLRDGGIKFWGF